MVDTPVRNWTRRTRYHAPDSALDASSMSSSALTMRQQLPLFRDEWLAPLVVEKGDPRERGGRLESERDELRRRFAELERQPTTDTSTIARSAPAPEQPASVRRRARTARHSSGSVADGVWGGRHARPRGSGAGDEQASLSLREGGATGVARGAHSPITFSVKQHRTSSQCTHVAKTAGIRREARRRPARESPTGQGKSGWRATPRQGPSATENRGGCGSNPRLGTS